MGLHAARDPAVERRVYQPSGKGRLSGLPTPTRGLCSATRGQRPLLRGTVAR